MLRNQGADPKSQHKYVFCFVCGWTEISPTGIFGEASFSIIKDGSVYLLAQVSY